MLRKQNACCYLWIGIIFAGIALWAIPSWADPQGDDLVMKSFNYMRGKASISTVDMTIHRSDWERVVTIQAWTRGEKESLFRITAPPKDKDNGTLKKGREMWTFNPKVNRTIKLPPSMMSQSWMGSDFSNNDLAKSDSLVYDYDHTITGEEIVDGHTIYSITSMPKPDAPVIWGMLKLKIRDDYIMLEEAFFDEDLELVKAMQTFDIQPVEGKLYPRAWKMRDADEPDRYTLLEYRHLEFLEHLPDRLFTLSALKTRRR